MEVGSIFISLTLEIAVSLLGKNSNDYLYESTGSTLVPHMKESFFVLFIEDTWATLYVVP